MCINSLENEIENEIKTEIEKKMIESNITVIKTSNVHILLVDIMLLVEKSKLKGEDQKISTLKILKETIISKSDEKNKNTLLELINDNTMGNIIDVIVSGTKNELKINKNKYLISKISKISNILLCCKKNKK